MRELTREELEALRAFRVFAGAVSWRDTLLADWVRNITSFTDLSQWDLLVRLRDSHGPPWLHNFNETTLTKEENQHDSNG